MNNYVDVLTKSEKQYDFNFVELFAGIGGVSFGFESIGGKCVLAAEYDPTAEGKRQFAQDAYKTLHPGTPVVGDVFNLDAADVPDHDVLSFTTPCQSFSVAGKRLGFEDTRGTLVFEALRIANEKRPKALFMENVKGLVNHDKGHTIDTILHAMNEIGYTVDFNVLNSKYFDVPQNRERVFIIALRDDLVEPSEWYPEGNTMLPKAKRRLKEAGLRTFNFDWPSQNSVGCRLRDVLETEVDPKYYLAEDKTAKLVAELETLKTPRLQQLGYVDKNAQGNRIYDAEGISGTMAAQTGGLGGSGAGLYLTVETGLPIREATTQGYAIAREGDAVNIAFPSSKTRRSRVGEQMANTLEASGRNQGVVERDPIIIDGSQRLREGKYRVYDDGISPTITAREYKEPRMVGKIEVLGNLKPHRNNSLANSVVSVEGISMTLDTMQGGQREPKIAEEVRPVITPDRTNKCQNGLRVKEDGEEAFTCTSIDQHGVAIGEYPQYRIRKLTPRECMRLQGFPESATDRLYAEGFSDSRIYKFAGNAVTTTVIKALAERLLPLIDESEAKINE